MSESFIICARDVRGERGQERRFINEPGMAQFLLVPVSEQSQFEPSHAIGRSEWFKGVTEVALRGGQPGNLLDPGDVLVFVHGFKNRPDAVLRMHRQLQRQLSTIGYRGAVVSFDWPSADWAINYLEDRHDAKQTAFHLVTDCIQPLAIEQRGGCTVNVHILAHSTGAYVVREAFSDADDCRALREANWTISQVIFVAGDVSRGSMSESHAGSDSLYRHCTRLTNYWNPYDKVLTLSNVKRLGIAPRVGRVGLPNDAPSMAVNVNCGERYSHLVEQNSDICCHSWYLDDSVLMRDVYETIKGDLDREVIAARRLDSRGGLSLT